MNEEDFDSRYRELIHELKENALVFAAILSGSRVKEKSHRFSDTDMYIVVSDELGLVESGKLKKSISEKFAKGIAIDLSQNAVQSLSSFKTYAQIGSNTSWDRYALVHAVLEFDSSDGEVTQALLNKQMLSDEERCIEIESAFPGYLNYVYRSIQSLRHGHKFAALLDAANSIQFLLRMLFSLHNRVTPFNKFLTWEVENYPLPAIGGAELRRRLRRIATKASLQDQQVFFHLITKLARKQGFGHFVDKWGAKMNAI